MSSPRVFVRLFLTVALLLANASAQDSPAADHLQRQRVVEEYGQLPLAFEANHGLTDARVKFLSRTSGYTLFLTGDEAVLTLRGSKTTTQNSKIAGAARRLRPSMDEPKTDGVLRMKLSNANPAAKVTGEDELAGMSNYFIGNDPTKWHTNVPTYAKVKYEGIYSGIDLIYYGNQRQLEYDFIVAPGADPRRIAFDIRGAKRIRRDEHGDLVLKMGEDEIRWHKPVVYQEKDGARQEIAARYAITDKNRVRFAVAQYDAGRPLYIDPLIYSTYLGGSSDDTGQGIAVDSSGNAYVTGFTCSTDFPTMNPLQPSYGGGGSFLCGDAFVIKINPSGSALVYSTYLGGSDLEHGNGVAVDSSGNVYVTGLTFSTNFPVTPGAFQTICNGCATGNEDAFVSNLNPTGSALVYSTYLGGRAGATGNGIAVDTALNAYVTGSAGADFPTMNPLQPTYGGGGDDTFVTKINPAGSALIYSTYLGGSSFDHGYGIAVDSAGDAYVIGNTQSTDFPVTPGAFQTICNGCATYHSDAFLSQLNPTGSALVYSTYLGGSGLDLGYGIAVDSAGNAYVTGSTDSRNFPTMNAFRKTNSGGQSDTFVTKLNPAGSALFSSTYLGGSGRDQGNGIAVDSSGNVYVTGLTFSTNFPVTLGAFQRICAGYGGTLCLRADAFVTKIQMLVVTTTALTSSPNPSSYSEAVTFTATVTSSLGAPPYGETVTFMKGKTVLGTVALSGGSASFTTSALPVATNWITAVYGGDLDFKGSKSKAVSQVVSKATTTTTVASSQNPSKVGQSVTFTAKVTPQFSGTVKGTVTFYDGTTVLKTASLSGGVAKFTISTLASGAHTITATYNGSTSFIGSSASLIQTVN